MRTIDKNYNPLDNYDLSSGKLIPVKVIREDALKPDNVTKFAYYESDYEDAYMYIEDPAQDTESQLTDGEKLALFAKSITEEERPEEQPEEGYTYERSYNKETGTIVWKPVPEKKPGPHDKDKEEKPGPGKADK